MPEELKQYNSLGDRNGIIYFAKTVLNNGKIKLESARQICALNNGIRINFNGAVAFFAYLGFLNVSNDLAEPTEQGKHIYSLLAENAVKFEGAFCNATLNKVIEDGIANFSSLKFDAAKKLYKMPRHAFPFSAAVFRNVLMQFNALAEQPDGTLKIAAEYEPLFSGAQLTSRRHVSLDALKKKLERQEAQGEAAELFVLGYENDRLKDIGNVNKAKRISDIDVSAGYDIVSFDNAISTEYDRFIEAKSFIGQPHFYWTKNEMDTALLLGDKYFIYLVDSEKISQSGYEPTVISNPAETILHSDGWLLQPTTYLVLPVGD